MEPAKLWNTFKAKAVGRSGISQAFQEGCILLLPHTFVGHFFPFHWALSTCSYLGTDDTGYIPWYGDCPVTPSYAKVWTPESMPAMCGAGLGPSKEPSVKPWLLSSPWFFYFEHWMTTIRGLWKGEQYLHKEAAFQNWLLVGSRPVFKFYLHYVWQEFRWVTLSPRFNFFLYQLPPSSCWETDWACGCPPSAPLYLVGLALLSHEVLV